MSPTTRRVLFALKLVVAVYWVWVLRANFIAEPSTFDAVIALSAPLLLSMHFLEGLMFVRWLRGRGPWVIDFAQIMLFGVLHLWPLLRQAPRTSPRGATESSAPRPNSPQKPAASGSPSPKRR